MAADVRVVPFEPKHMASLAGRLNASQALPDTECTEEFGERMANVGPGYAAVHDDGRTLAVCGAMQFWPGRMHLWAFFAVDAGPYMLAITRGVKRFLATVHDARVEAEISEGFELGHRWARMLGLKCETPQGMEAFFPNGVRGYMYARPPVDVGPHSQDSHPCV